VLGRGKEGLVAFICGYVVGDLIWFVLAATGMAMLARSAHLLFVCIRYAGAAYLLYLAVRLWTSPVQPTREKPLASPAESRHRLFLSSLALTLSNPKAALFYLALLPAVLDLSEMTTATLLEVAAAICIILSSVLTAYSMAALRARRLFRSPRAMRWLNRGTGTVMAGAALGVATRS